MRMTLRELHPEASKIEYRVACTNWFDGAKDRNGERKQRRNNLLSIILKNYTLIFLYCSCRSKVLKLK